jgi:hypothetical protein
MNQPPDQPSAASRVQVHLPGNLEPVYANFALITHSHSEIVIDFAQIMPQVPQARVKARLVMTPTNAKLLARALNEHLLRYEAQHGEIRVPEGTSLAERLFRQDKGPGKDAGDGPPG